VESIFGIAVVCHIQWADCNPFLTLLCRCAPMYRGSNTATSISHGGTYTYTYTQRERELVHDIDTPAWCRWLHAYSRTNSTVYCAKRCNSNAYHCRFRTTASFCDSSTFCVACGPTAVLAMRICCSGVSRSRTSYLALLLMRCQSKSSKTRSICVPISIRVRCFYDYRRSVHVCHTRGLSTNQPTNQPTNQSLLFIAE
jgi:hypothetical protein